MQLKNTESILTILFRRSKQHQIVHKRSWF